MNKAHLLKELRKEDHQIKQKIDKIQDPNKKRQLIRNYAEVISAVVDISEIIS